VEREREGAEKIDIVKMAPSRERLEEKKKTRGVVLTGFTVRELGRGKEETEEE